MTEVVETAKIVVDYHIKLHGKNGVVHYALIDDVMRKTNHRTPREVIEDVVCKIMKED